MADQTADDIERENMVASQVRPNQVNDPRVLAAMRLLPREAFAPPGCLPYSDADISLGEKRYLLSPMITARLAQLALAQNPEHALVIGAGAGYLAAILAKSGVQVVALEESARLDTGALKRFAPEVTAVSGKLIAGWPAAGPYDVIVIDGAVYQIPDILRAQLTKNGQIVTILADGAEPVGLGRGVVAQPSAGGFACAKYFDCTARVLPGFLPAPAFSF